MGIGIRGWRAAAALTPGYYLSQQRREWPLADICHSNAVNGPRLLSVMATP